MVRKLSSSLLVLALLVVGAACAKKKPVTAAAAAPATATASTAPAAPAAAPSVAAAGADPWAADPGTLDRWVHEQGLLVDVYFDYDRFELRPDARQGLQTNGRFLADHPELVVRVEGHCDERGTADYNLALGQNRAGGARAYVSHLGVPAERLAVVSFGKERPVCGEPDESCRWRNRRAAFVIVGRRAG